MKSAIKRWIVLSSTSLLAACGQQQGEEIRPVRKDITEYVFASGSLEAANEYTLTALTEGYLTNLSIGENDLVKAGAVIGSIDNEQNAINTAYAGKLLELARSNRDASAPSLQQAKANVAAAKEKLAYDSGMLARYSALLKAGTIPMATYQSIELQYNTSQADYESTLQQYNLLTRQADENVIVNESKKQVYQSLQAANAIKVIKAGMILKKYKSTGDFVRKGDAIALIGEANHVYARVEVDENSIARIKTGQPAIIKLNSLPGKVFNGIVDEILPVYDENKQAFTVKLRFNQHPEQGIIKTQLQANIETGITRNALLIPRKYLDFADQVYLKGGKDPVKLTVSFVSTDWVRVLSGIDESSILVLNTEAAQ